jgi:hypothetical protein
MTALAMTDPTHAGQLDTASPPADQHLAAHILQNHTDALNSWEVAFIRSMAGVRARHLRGHRGRSGDYRCRMAAHMGLRLSWRHQRLSGTLRHRCADDLRRPRCKRYRPESSPYVRRAMVRCGPRGRHMDTDSASLRQGRLERCPEENWPN